MKEYRIVKMYDGTIYVQESESSLPDRWKSIYSLPTIESAALIIRELKWGTPSGMIVEIYDEEGNLVKEG